jgi:hypothetical protein
MSIETEVAALTTATTSLTNAVLTQQTSVAAAVATFAATTATVDNDLNLVDNTADVDKPVSTAAQTALDARRKPKHYQRCLCAKRHSASCGARRYFSRVFGIRPAR